MDNIIEVQFNEMLQRTRSIWQYDYGQVLKILSGGVVLPNFLEVHFSLSRENEKCITRIGTTVNGVTEVQIPNELLNTENKTHDYFIYAFIYVSTEKYGNTKCEIIIPVKSRIKPENPSEEPLPEPNIFHETVEAVNAAADRAKMAEQNAKESATEAGKYAASASKSAVTAEKTKEDALRKVGEKKQEAIEAIQNQEETSVGKITTHTDGEIKRIQNQAAESKGELEQTITNADVSKKELEHSIETAGTSKTALDKSVELAGTAKTELDTSTQKAGEANTALDGSVKTAGEMQETLSATVKQAGALDTSLGEKIKTGTQLKTDLTASGEKAVQDIQTAGSEQLGKMQAIAEAFTADREQIATNKEDIGSLKEDIGDLKSVMKDIRNNTPHASTIKTFYDVRRTGKVYQTKIWKFATNPTSSGEKLLDNAGLEFIPSTDTTEGKDDYLNGNHPLFDWVHCNYKRYDDGTAYPIATEYDDTYQATGSVDVGAMQMSFWWNWDASNPEYDLVTISDTPNEKYKLKPWTECKRADRTITPWCIGSAYVSGIASDGLLRSQPGLKPERNQSHKNMITNYQKKGKGCCGAGAERNTFQILFNIIKGATKNSQSLFQGCTGYNFQYSASVQSADMHTYFPVTNAQAENILVGSYVSVGYGQLNDGKNGVNNDRGVANIHKYADDVKVLKIETLDANNKAVYLDIETGFNTMPIKLSDTVNAPIAITAMHWWSGSTDKVIGRHDGSFGSNTDRKHPYRVQGREYAVGGYMVASDTVMDFQSDYSKKVYVAPKGVAHSSSDVMIRNTYTCVGTIPANPDGSGSDFWVGDIAVDVDTGVWFPSAKGSSDSQGFADMLYAGGKSTSGMREYLQGGNLGDWSSAGSAYVNCGCWLGGAGWDCLGCD